MPSYELKTIQSLAEIADSDWNRLAGKNPFLQHVFLFALEKAKCAIPETGWFPQHLVCLEAGELVGALPLYMKTHSFGEFVFDRAWADAYESCGLPYYPKPLSAVPFTPVAGNRILGNAPEVRSLLRKGALQIAKQSKLSSLHILFPSRAEAEEWRSDGFLIRESVQFHWRNQNYKSFDSYLESLRHDKRKKIKQERRKVREAGISFRQLTGTAIRKQDWDFFYECYVHTHQQYQSPQALNREFFECIEKELSQNILLILGDRMGVPICGALNFMNDEAIFGRSWGALEAHDSLHFEACYYQAIEFCISRGLQLFEGGAQGEHKFARGFLPEKTWSAHWLRHPEFSQAVDNFLKTEAGQIAQYVDELMDSNPFKTLPL